MAVQKVVVIHKLFLEKCLNSFSAFSFNFHYKKVFIINCFLFSERLPSGNDEATLSTPPKKIFASAKPETSNVKPLSLKARVPVNHPFTIFITLYKDLLFGYLTFNRPIEEKTNSNFIGRLHLLR